MALIKLTGKYAIGPHEFAIVDDDMVEYLSQWRWKAKPNGNHNNVYAVRNAYVDGKCTTVRMHRVVAGLDKNDPLEVDHDNHNSLDNRRANLIPSTRSQNALNTRRVVQTGSCKHCDNPVARIIGANHAHLAIVCQRCRAFKPALSPVSAVFFMTCKQCGVAITGRQSTREFCSDRCRCKMKYANGYRRPTRSASAVPTAAVPPAAGLAALPGARVPV